MRSDEQVNKCIDALFSRVQQLEAEVAQLKGTPPPEAAQQSAALSAIEATARRHTEQSQRTAAVLGSGNTLESAIGTRWIGRIGILAILFGVVFFLKYSFDNKLIGEAGRVMLGIFWGAAFIGIGEYLQKKKGLSLYGQMLSAGGLGVLYLALYAAFALYHLIPAPLALTAMVAVTTTGMTLSIRYGTYSLAAIALLGGFLTPLMLSTGQNQPLTLFGYILILDMGVLLLMRFRFWPSLVSASLAGTALLYLGWHSEYFTAGQRWTAFAVIALFFVFYTLYSLVSRLYSEREETRSDQVIIFGSAAFFLMAFISQQEISSWTVKSFTLILAAVEIGLAELVRRRAPAARLSVACFAATSVIVTVVATFVALEQRWTLPALAAEMAAFCWIGLRLELPYLRRASYIIALLALFRFADDVHLHLEPFQRFTPLLNERFLICGMAIAGFYCCVTGLPGNRRGWMPVNGMFSERPSSPPRSSPWHCCHPRCTIFSATVPRPAPGLDRTPLRLPALALDPLGTLRLIADRLRYHPPDSRGPNPGDAPLGNHGAQGLFCRPVLAADPLSHGLLYRSRPSAAGRFVQL